MAGGVPVTVPTYVEHEFQVTGADLEARITPRTRAILISYPNNPTGAVLTLKHMQEVAAVAEKHDLVVISDEIYERLVYGIEHTCFAALPGMFERTILMSGMSKSFAMTGWRVGWLIAPKIMGQAIENLVQYNTSGTTTFLQRGCIAALERGEAFLAGQVERAARGRDIVCEALASAPGVEFAKPEGAFYLFFRIEGGGDSTLLSRRLIDETGVGCAPGSAFGPSGEGFLRISYLADPAEIETAVAKIGEIYQALVDSK